MPITRCQHFTFTQDVSYTTVTEIIIIRYSSSDSVIMINNFSQLNLDYRDTPAFSWLYIWDEVWTMDGQIWINLFT